MVESYAFPGLKLHKRLRRYLAVRKMSEVMNDGLRERSDSPELVICKVDATKVYFKPSIHFSSTSALNDCLITRLVEKDPEQNLPVAAQKTPVGLRNRHWVGGVAYGWLFGGLRTLRERKISYLQREQIRRLWKKALN